MAYEDEPKPKPPKEPKKDEDKENEPKADGGDIIGMSGFNYTQRWGSKRGQKGAFNLGGRPPAKADWDAMTQEERDAVGVPDWETWSSAHEAWQKRHAIGGDIYDERTKMAEAIVGSGATTWDQVKQALLRAGFSQSIHEQGPMFKQLQMAFEGAADPSGRYHRSPGGWVDVSTSDLAKRGIPGMADYSGPGLSGMEAIYGALPQTHDIRRFQEWLNRPGTNANQLLQYQNNGMYGTGAQRYDQFGNLIDVATGKRVGHYYPGDTRAHYGGGGTNVDWGTPTMPTQGGGGGNPLQGIFGGGGVPQNMEELMRELAKILGIQLPKENLEPQIIPMQLMPGQQQPGLNGEQQKTPAPIPQPAQQPPAPAPAPMAQAQMPNGAQPVQTAAWGTTAPPVQMNRGGATGIFGGGFNSTSIEQRPTPTAPSPTMPSPGMPSSGQIGGFEKPYQPPNILQPRLMKNMPKPAPTPRKPGSSTGQVGIYGNA